MNLDPTRLLEDLDPEQRDAVLATTGPVAILAGAGTGKTRVMSRRVAYAIATEVVDADQVLVVTFTEKAAREMVERLRMLGLPEVTARTFHAHALSQLRHFWPGSHEGMPLPELLDSKLPLIARLVRQLPGHYRFTPSKDIADAIEWAKVRRIEPAGYEREILAAGSVPGADVRTSPLPVDLFVGVYDEYEQAKLRANRIDFEDLLLHAVDLLDGDVEAARTVRARKRWFSVDEYQDTNPLQQRLLELWLGDREDLCVVGDEDQTIYTFTGASSTFLTTFAERHPRARVLALTRNYRSTPQVLELANRLIAADGRSKLLVATRPDGPVPQTTRHANADAEMAALAASVRERIADGTAPAEIAVLVRTNAQLVPVEEALTRVGIPYQVRGLRFYDRPEVSGAIAAVKAAAPMLATRGSALPAAIRALWAKRLGYDEGGSPEGDEARERAAALDTLLAILDGLVRAAGGATVDARAFVAELERRAMKEREGSADGVNLLTYHRAKGLEWDAVFLPMLEEGSLPIRQAAEDDNALAEERRLLYVGITRARVHLRLSWAERREVRGREVKRQASRFLLDFQPRAGTRVRQLPDGFATPMVPARGEGPPPTIAGDRDGDPVFVALREWRTAQAREEAVPPYVIAHDSTLAEIADQRPRTMAALRRVKGMGPTKLERYGDEILAIVAQAAPLA
jgi:DNA helicase II / ATP-dependent DNA helicase PcrA